MAVTKRLRTEILKRDNHTCRYCGAKAPDVTLTIDHVIPTALGGSDKPENLVTACRDCNAGKTSVHPDSVLVADVDARAVQWAAAMRQAAEDMEAADYELASMMDGWSGAWGYHENQHGGPGANYLPAGWRASLAAINRAGLSWDSMTELVSIAWDSRAAADRKFAYFCGCCWTRIRQMQERALEIVGSDPEGELSAEDRAEVDSLHVRWEGFEQGERAGWTRAYYVWLTSGEVPATKEACSESAKAAAEVRRHNVEHVETGEPDSWCWRCLT